MVVFAVIGVVVYLLIAAKVASFTYEFADRWYICLSRGSSLSSWKVIVVSLLWPMTLVFVMFVATVLLISRFVVGLALFIDRSLQ